MRSVWLEVPNDYVERCGKCGKHRHIENLRMHWFFKGVYCLNCIIDVYYDDTKSMREAKL